MKKEYSRDDQQLNSEDIVETWKDAIAEELKEHGCPRHKPRKL